MMPTRTIPVVSFEGLSPIPERELSAAGWEIKLVTTVADARSLVRNNDFCAGLVIFPRAKEPDLDGMEEILQEDKSVEWLALVQGATLALPEAARFVRDMFYDFHTLPADPYRLLVTLGHAHGRAALKRRADADGAGAQDHRMLGESPAMRQLQQQIQKVQRDDAPILITGESGTGKELAARTVHRLSSRRQGPFVAVNCGAIPQTLVQSELFGYERGAFTGASRRKIGKIESAAGGTILLDEVGDLPLQIQVNLLRFLQERTIERVGSTRSLPVDVRVIAATNVDLEDAVQKGLFREDLYYRLNVLRLHLPPLRDRGQDLELLARAFLEEFSLRLGRKSKRFSRQAVRAMYDHQWPGNIRELFNRVRRGAVVSEGGLIQPADLGLDTVEPCSDPCSLEQARERAEVAAIQQSLRRNRNNVSEAARELGVSRVTLYRLMNKLRLAHQVR